MKASRQARREGTELFRFCQVNGLLDQNRARSAVDKLIETKPRGYLETLAVFLRLVKLDAAQHIAKVESAVPLPAELQSGVQKSLAQVYGQGLSASFATNAALIGGVRIQVGSDVYDGSVKARLAALEQSF
jgi:F-type H+-transporting ATPase subunit delta